MAAGHLELLIKLRAFERLAVQPRVLDRDGGFRTERLEGRARRPRAQRAPHAAVEVEDPDHLVLGTLFGFFDIVDEAKRCAEDVTDAKRDRAHMLAGVGAFHQVLDDPLLTRGEDTFGDLPAGSRTSAPTGSLGPGRVPA